MAKIHKFKALRPSKNSIQYVASVPYDVVSRNEASQLAKGNSLSFLHVSRAEIDLSNEVNPYSPEVYEKAKRNLDYLKKSAPLTLENESSLYIYQLKTSIGGQSKSQTGVAAVYSIDEYENGDIRRHEKTRIDKEDDRTNHLMSLGAQTGPVFLTYRGIPKIQDLVAQVKQTDPLYEFTCGDSVQHTVWKVEKSTELVNLFSLVPRLYIADGHHRAASAWRVRDLLRKQNPSHNGNEAYNFFLAVAFPADELTILPYNRIVKTLGSLSATQFLDKIISSFEITEITLNGAISPPHGQFSMYLSNRWMRLKPLMKAADDVVSCLDVSILQDRILSPILGISDPRTDSRIDFVGGIRGHSELENRVKSGAAKVAFALHPTTVNDLMSVSDAEKIMPPKSTWFEPKLRDGILSHQFIKE